ncbi:UTP--glucose-1-phosphate uridylyltransferase GalU [Porticoccaceae bacterium]|jgi:UTP--glucose-1-phosphate uridylyltransferase|nr:UTP--glucose-1-phosphate uridylyltransferase GalU [Porticoccaceae bacterium]
MVHVRRGEKVRKAVFPVAGMGTRFLPATKANPKEMLPVVDKPLIQYAVEEAVAAGITEMIFITGRNKRSIADHFDKAYELEHQLEKSNKTKLLDIAQNIVPKGVSCTYIRQNEALGLGHAVSTAAHLIGDEPFAVILADDLIHGEKGAVQQMVELYEFYKSSVIAVQKVPGPDISAYGVISGKLQADRVYLLDKIVEKPALEDAPSDMGVTGRYIFTPQIFKHLAMLKPGAGGEFQLTDAIQTLLTEEQVLAYEYSGTRYDCGSKMGLLKANIELGLLHSEVGEELRSYLRDELAAKL